MLDCLPKYIEPVGLADVGRSFRGSVAVADMPRLAPALFSSDGELGVQLEFALDERRIRTAKGTITGNLELVCQRCLGALRFPLDLRVRLGIVSGEDEIKQLPEGYEPLLVSGEPLETLAVVEDEVLLAIPAIPRHSGEDACATGYENQPLPEPENPFAVLEKLKS